MLVAVDDSSALRNSMSESEKPKKAPKKRGRHRRLEQRGVEAAVAAKPAASTTTSAGSPLADMVAELEHRCPALCPAIIPAGLDDREDGVALLALCADAAERAALLAALRAARAAAPPCALTGRRVPEEQLRFVALWRLRPAAGAYELARCAFVCVEAARLLDPAAFLERFCRAGKADKAELAAAVELFCATNAAGGGPAARVAGKPREAQAWAQECYALAHACRVLAASTRWAVRGPDGAPLAEAGPLPALVARMLGGGEAGTAPKKKKRPRLAT